MTWQTPLRSPPRQQGRPCWRGGLVIALLITLSAGPLAAEEVQGVFKEVSARHDALTLTIRGQERTLPLAPGVKVLGLTRTPLKDGLGSKLFRRPGVLLLVKTEHRDGQDVAVELLLIRRSLSPFVRNIDG